MLRAKRTRSGRPPRLHFALRIHGACRRRPTATGSTPCFAVLLACFSPVHWPFPAAAQVQRNFTAKALRGEIVFGTPPEVKLNGKPARLAPGCSSETRTTCC